MDAGDVATCCEPYELSGEEASHPLVVVVGSVEMRPNLFQGMTRAPMSTLLVLTQSPRLATPQL